MVNEYIAQLDAMIPPTVNINFFSPYIVLNIIKKLSNNKVPDFDRIITTIIKNFAFKMILQLYYVIRTSIILCYFSKI